MKIVLRTENAKNSSGEVSANVEVSTDSAEIGKVIKAIIKNELAAAGADTSDASIATAYSKLTQTDKESKLKQAGYSDQDIAKINAAGVVL